MTCVLYTWTRGEMENIHSASRDRALLEGLRGRVVSIPAILIGLNSKDPVDG
jgi:hypothetical protein